MGTKRMRAQVHGRVQGVAFREYTRREAERLGLSGWVRNLPDNSVEALFEGRGEAVDSLLAWLAIGSPHAQVVRVVAEEESPSGEMGPFIIRHDPL